MAGDRHYTAGDDSGIAFGEPEGSLWPSGRQTPMQRCVGKPAHLPIVADEHIDIELEPMSSR